MRLFATFAALLFSTSVFAAQPPRFNYQAKLDDPNGVPLSGNQDLFFSLWHGGNSTSGGTKVFEETVTVNAANGVVNHTVGTGQNQNLGALSSSDFQFSGDIYLQVGVSTDINVITPRTRLESVPFAITSADGDARVPIQSNGTFPIVISSPGSYYFTGNITGVDAQSGIDVQASGVTIDLNGYSLIGVAGSLDGIFMAGGGTLDNLTVLNGTVRDWGQDGIDCDGANGGRFKDLKVTDNRGNGIRAGSLAIVENCLASFNNKNGNSAGISVFNNSIIRNCVADGNSATASGTATGILAFDDCSIIGCNARDNNAFGPTSGYGIDVSDRCTVANNTCNGNSAGATGGVTIGINTSSACVITGNTCNSNVSTGGNSSSAGIFSGLNCGVFDNVCTGNTATGSGSGAGIVANSRSRLERNQCVSNGGGAAGYGIRVSNNATGGTMLIKNTTSNNDTAGIRFDNGTAINYCAENVIDEGTPISNPGSNVFGAGDRSNVNF